MKISICVVMDTLVCLVTNKKNITSLILHFNFRYKNYNNKYNIIKPLICSVQQGEVLNALYDQDLLIVCVLSYELGIRSKRVYSVESLDQSYGEESLTRLKSHAHQFIICHFYSIATYTNTYTYFIIHIILLI